MGGRHVKEGGDASIPRAAVYPAPSVRRTTRKGPSGCGHRGPSRCGAGGRRTGTRTQLGKAAAHRPIVPPLASGNALGRGSANEGSTERALAEQAREGSTPAPERRVTIGAGQQRAPTRPSPPSARNLTRVRSRPRAAAICLTASSHAARGDSPARIEATTRAVPAIRVTSRFVDAAAAAPFRGISQPAQSECRRATHLERHARCRVAAAIAMRGRGP